MKPLTIQMIANQACAVGIGMGFNCAEVQRIYDIETNKTWLHVIWGDAKELNQPRLRTPMEWARAYVEDEPCTREPRTLNLVEEDVAGSVDSLRSKFYEALLELAA